jgi:hypothetical protein
MLLFGCWARKKEQTENPRVSHHQLLCIREFQALYCNEIVQCSDCISSLFPNHALFPSLCPTMQ